MATLLSVTDLTAPERSVTVDATALGPLLAGWWAELGLSTAVTRSHVRMLVGAVRAGDWVAAHRIAEHVSLDVHAVPPGRANWSPSDRWAFSESA